MDLDRLTAQPTTIRIGDRDYQFSELTFDQLGRLQQWIRANVPNPLVALRPQLPDFTPAQQAVLLDGARREALAWPPKIGTAAGAAAVLGSEDGQLEVLFVALQSHQPELSRDDATRIYRALKRESMADRRRKARGEAVESTKASRIFALAFGMDELLDDEDADPKAETPTATPASPSPTT